MKINIILADDHPALILGIKQALAGIHTISVVGTARNSTEIVELLSREMCDVLVTDYTMPGGKFGDGMALISFLRRRYPALRLIVFTAIENPAMTQGMLKLGVQSVLGKIDDVGHLITAIHAVHAGAVYVLQGDRNSGPRVRVPRPVVNGIEQLSKREAEVVRLYVSGWSINEIAVQVHRTKQTVSAQKTSAMRKLGVTRDADLFRFAYETGLMVEGAPRDVR